jgi:mono/diheme cytochrome c family protein
MRLNLNAISLIAIAFLIFPACRSSKKETTNSAKPDSLVVSSPIVEVAGYSGARPPIATSLTRPAKTKNAVQSSPSPLETFSVSVEVARDTVLQTPGGVFIHIPANALDAGGVTIAKLEIHEALKISDIIRAGLFTQTDGKPLSSGGMIQIEAAAGQSVKIIKSIGVSVPTSYLDPKMQVYKGVAAGNAVTNWTDPRPLIKNAETMQIDTGKKLFVAYCASCHGINKPITGPALAYISRLRNQRWLYAYTRNSKGDADSVDLYADCLYNEYGKTPMPEYRSWSDKQISAVYSYIDNESKRLGLSLPPDHLKKCVDSCIWYDAEYGRLTKRRSKLIGENGSRVNRKETPAAGPVPDYRDSKTQPDNYIPPKVLPKVNAPYYQSVYYQFSIQTFGWYNIDVLVSESDGVKKSELIVRLQGSYTSEMNVFFILPSAKVFQEGGPLAGGKNEFGFYKVDGSIYLQQSVKATVMTMGERDGKIIFDMVSFQTSEKQTLTLTPAVITKDQMNSVLKSLDLPDINPQVQDSKNGDAVRAIDVQLKDLEVFKPKTCDCNCGRILDVPKLPEVQTRQ